MHERRIEGSPITTGAKEIIVWRITVCYEKKGRIYIITSIVFSSKLETLSATSEQRYIYIHVYKGGQNEDNYHLFM